MSFTGDLQEIVERNESRLLGAHPSWSRVRLGDVAVILNGFPFDSKYFSKSEGVPLIRIRDILGDSTDTRFTGPLPEGYWVDRGDLLVGMDGDFNCAQWRGGRALLNQRVCRITAAPKFMVPSFLARVLGGYLAAINGETSSITVKHLSSKTIAEVPLPYPPLQEQKRIADKLDALLARVDACRERLDRVPGILKRFRQSVLAAATSGELTRDWREAHGSIPGTASSEVAESLERRRERVGFKEPPPPDTRALRGELPASWALVSVAAVAECLDARRVPIKKERRERAVGRYPYYGANGQVDLVDDFLFDDELVLVTEDETFYGRTKPIAYRSSGRCWVNNHVHVLRPHDGSWADYLCYCLMYRDVTPWLTGTTGRAKLTQAALNALPVMVPPTAEVLEIVRRVRELLTWTGQVLERVKAATEIVGRVEPSILAKSFRGELVPQDPNDEPASELLARLRAGRSGDNGTEEPKRSGTSDGSTKGTGRSRKPTAKLARSRS